MFTNFYPPNLETLSINEYYEPQSTITIPYKNIASKIKILKKINDFAALEENWDSYNAGKISASTIEKAIEFVNFLDRKNIEIYYTAPSPSGDILLELRSKSKILEIEVLSENKITFTAYEDDNLYKSGYLDNELANDIIKWYLD